MHKNHRHGGPAAELCSYKCILYLIKDSNLDFKPTNQVWHPELGLDCLSGEFGNYGTNNKYEE